MQSKKQRAAGKTRPAALKKSATKSKKAKAVSTSNTNTNSSGSSGEPSASDSNRSSSEDDYSGDSDAGGDWILLNMYMYVLYRFYTIVRELEF